MKFLFDLLPVILFFGVYKLAGANEDAAFQMAGAWLGDGVTAKQVPILLATVVAILATFGQIAWVWARHRKVEHHAVGEPGHHRGVRRRHVVLP